MRAEWIRVGSAKVPFWVAMQDPLRNPIRWLGPQKIAALWIGVRFIMDEGEPFPPLVVRVVGPDGLELGTPCKLQPGPTGGGASGGLTLQSRLLVTFPAPGPYEFRVTAPESSTPSLLETRLLFEKGGGTPRP